MVEEIADGVTSIELVCSLCSKFEEEVFRQLEVCPGCGADLLARVNIKKDIPRKQDLESVAHPIEAEYANTKVNRADSVPIVEIDAHELLHYARLRAEIAKTIESFFDRHEDSMVIGFLTGSVGLSVTARRLIGERGVGRFRFTQGLAHGTAATAAYHKLLDEVTGKGFHHILILDEIISGGQMRTNLYATRGWVKSNDKNKIEVTVLGIHEGSEKSGHKVLRETVQPPPKDKPDWGFDIEWKVLAAPKLLEKDKPGAPFRGIIRKVGRGEYEIHRVWKGPVLIKCKNWMLGGESKEISDSAGSLDQIFGYVIEQIIGAETCKDFLWPERIKRASCDECKSLLNAARFAYGTLSVVRSEDYNDKSIYISNLEYK